MATNEPLDLLTGDATTPIITIITPIQPTTPTTITKLFHEENPAVTTTISTKMADLIIFSDDDDDDDEEHNENQENEKKQEEEEGDLIAFSSSSDGDEEENDDENETLPFKTLFNIPLPPFVTPLCPPELFKQPPTLPPLPPLPVFPFNLDPPSANSVLKSKGRVLIGPISESAREDWRLDGGLGYFRSKLGGGPGGGVYSSVLVEDSEGKSYCLVAFESGQEAERCREVFRWYCW
ncbi:hypothetical protein QBC42DRAFT_288213 [Cladorrhinum samala]|uniref:Uncharacterized protein n=1 Tax=Cladorrhinum samala TaxID=585594 RepID=A0AAV9HLC1_9PEZI|nr:hypothetical protein QBC42DRAFT_288213 [Cladorrhinum samala]